MKLNESTWEISRCKISKGRNGSLYYWVQDDALVLPKSSLFVNYLQTEKHHANIGVLFQSVFYIFYLLLDKEKVAKKEKQQNLRSISFYVKCSWKIVLHLGNKKNPTSKSILLSKYFFLA